MNNSILFPLLLTLFAGLSTGIGSLIAFFAHKTNTKFLSFSLGLSAGVMIYVSFVELFIEAKETLIEYYQSPTIGYGMTVLYFFIGMAVIALIDRLVPSYENPHEIRSIEDMNSISESEIQEKIKTSKLKRAGIMAAIAIAIHNFPEGIATFMSAVNNIQLGIAISVAIAIHNIPEGIAVSIPIYYATGSKRKAFWLSFLSGISEVIGGLLAYFILMPYITPQLLGGLFASVAGIMVYISLDELLPTSEAYGEHHISLYGILTGMLIMALSLVLMS